MLIVEIDDVLESRIDGNNNIFVFNWKNETFPDKAIR
jgi:hypothetical protein